MRLPGLLFLTQLALFLLALSPPLSAQQTGTRHAVSYPSGEGELAYDVFLPPAYATDTLRRFPVIYWLHGTGGYPPGVVEMLAGRFNGAMASGRIPPAIVVFLHDGSGSSLWVDDHAGTHPLESTIVQVLVPKVDSVYRTLATPAGRLLEGGSMGGYGVARLGFRYPDRFGAVSMLSAGPLQPVLDPDDAPIVGADYARKILDDVFGGNPAIFRSQSPWALAEAYAADPTHDLALRMIVGGADEIYANNLRFAGHLDSLGIAHDFTVLENVPHQPKALFAALGDDYWTFIADFLRAAGE